MRILFTGIIALILLIGGYVLWWNRVADRLVAYIDAWQQQRIAEGYEISHGPLVVSDFPYRVRITMENLSITAPQPGLQPHLEMKEFWAVVEPWNLTHAIFGLTGGGEVSWGEGDLRKSVRLNADTAHGSATFDRKGHLHTTAIDFKQVAIQPSWRAPITADRLQLHSRPAPAELRKGEKGKDLPASDPALQIAVRGDNITVSDLQDFPLGEKLHTLGLSMILHGRMAMPPDAERIAQWRDAGGYVQILDLKADWGPGNLEGEGSLTVDNGFYPLGKIKSKISGYPDILAALLKAKRISPKAARMLSFGLPMLAKKKADGTQYLALPLSSEDGGLYLGPLFLMPLDPLFSG